METSIISQVARAVFLKDSKVPVELQSSPPIVSLASDSITLSQTAQDLSLLQSNGGAFEAEHAAQFQQIKHRVRLDYYQIDKAVIEGIALKISAMFI